MKVLVIGVSGFLGKKISHIFSKHHEVLGTFSSKNPDLNIPLKKMDLGNQKEVLQIFSEFNPELVINCAAVCNVDQCKNNQKLAYQVHVTGSKNLVFACKKYSAKLVYISTDYIFSGRSESYTENSIPDPLNYYGVTKYLGEEVIKNGNITHLIIRTSILYGFNDLQDKSTLVMDLLDKLKREKEVYLDNERIKYPVLIDDLADGIGYLVRNNAQGTFNFSTKKGYTRYEWGKLITKFFGYDESKIFPRNNSDYNQNRPKDVKLICDKLIRIGFQPLSLEPGLKLMKKQIGGQINENIEI